MTPPSAAQPDSPRPDRGSDGVPRCDVCGATGLLFREILTEGPFFCEKHVSAAIANAPEPGVPREDWPSAGDFKLFERWWNAGVEATATLKGQHIRESFDRIDVASARVLGAAREAVALRRALSWALEYGTFDVAIDNPLHARALDDARAALRGQHE